MHSTNPGLLGLPLLSIRGKKCGMVGLWECGGLYNPLIGILRCLAFPIFRSSLYRAFELGHHGNSEVLRLQRQVSEPGHQFLGQS